MKLATILTCSALLSVTTAFSVVQPPRTTSLTQQYMFGGAGAGAATEDDPETQQKIAQAAASMGMSVEEYQLGMNARIKLNDELTSMRVEAGNKDTVAIVRDGLNPPGYLEIIITDKGKEMGKENLSKELVAALGKASEDSKQGRVDAQKNMMKYISEEMKKLGIQ